MQIAPWPQMALQGPNASKLAFIIALQTGAISGGASQTNDKEWFRAVVAIVGVSID